MASAADLEDQDGADGVEKLGKADDTTGAAEDWRMATKSSAIEDWKKEVDPTPSVNATE